MQKENPGAPKVDLVTGNPTGYAYSANCGWCSLSNARAFLETDTLAPGFNKDKDGIADGWERTYTKTLTAFTAASDGDQDRSTDSEECTWPGRTRRTARTICASPHSRAVTQVHSRENMRFSR